MVTIATTKGTGTSNSVLNIYIVDTITGDILYHTYHTQAGGPVHIISSENWVTHKSNFPANFFQIVYHFWNVQNSRYEFSVLDLYEEFIYRDR
jgi:hypothetical protein